MIVFCVVNIDGEYGHEDLIAVYSTSEKADKAIEDLIVDRDTPYYHKWREPDWTFAYGLKCIEMEVQ